MDHCWVFTWERVGVTVTSIRWEAIQCGKCDPMDDFGIWYLICLGPPPVVWAQWCRILRILSVWLGRWCRTLRIYGLAVVGTCTCLFVVKCGTLYPSTKYTHCSRRGPLICSLLGVCRILRVRPIFGL
jgi:hypothetical protein